jgi:hypothetical protein
MRLSSRAIVCLLGQRTQIMSARPTRDIRACDVTDVTRLQRRDALTLRGHSGEDPEGPILFPAMQKDCGPNHPFDKKRKGVEDSNSVVDTSGKRTRKSKSQSETGETVKAEPQWPDYFKEVSVRENSLKLTLGTSFRQLFKVRSASILELSFPNSFPSYLDIQGLFCRFRRFDRGLTLFPRH